MVLTDAWQGSDVLNICEMGEVCLALLVKLVVFLKDLVVTSNEWKDCPLSDDTHIHKHTHTADNTTTVVINHSLMTHTHADREN